MKYYFKDRKESPYFRNDGNNRKRLETLTIEQLVVIAKYRRNGLKNVLIDFLADQNL